MFEQQQPRDGTGQVTQWSPQPPAISTTLFPQGAEDSSSCWKALTAWEYWLFQKIVMICSFFQTGFPQIAFLPSTPQPFQAPKKQTKVDVLVFI